MVIGLGGGALPIFLHNVFNLTVVTVELDGIIVELAQKHFGLGIYPEIQVRKRRLLVSHGS